MATTGATRKLSVALRAGRSRTAENNPEDGMKEVAVRVSWNSIGGRSHSVELKTLLAAE
jgi:hypothetical protein